MNKKAKSSAIGVILIVIVGIIAIGWLINEDKIKLPNFGAGVDIIDDAGTGDVQVNTGCAYAPTVQLTAVNEYDSSDTEDAVQYKLNGGAVSTDADGTFEVVKGEKLQVLWMYNNDSEFTPIAKEYTIDKCGKSEISFEALEWVNTSIQCFNEEGNVLDSTTSNETIGTGEAPTLKCELRGSSKTGLPMGGILTAELSGTVFKENDVEVSGLGSMDKSSSFWYGDPISQTLGAYSISATANKVRAFEIEPTKGAFVKTFYIYLPAEDAQNPANTDDITLRVYLPACYQEEDVSGGAFRCGMTDLDNSFQLDLTTSGTISID